MSESAGPADADRVVVDEWVLRYNRADPVSEGLRESLCTLGNGYFATRGAAPEAVDDGVHYPGTYVGGLYNRLTTTVAGREVENESNVNLPNWLVLSFRIDGGPWFDLAQLEVLDFRQELDLRRAVLSRWVRVRDDGGRVTQVEQRRFVSMHDPHLAALETILTPENWAGRLTVRSGIDGTVVNGGVARYRNLDSVHLADVTTEAVDAETLTLVARTSQSNIRIAEAARTRMTSGGTPVATSRAVVDEQDFIAFDLALDVEASDTVTVEKVVALYTSADRSISEPLLEARTKTFRVGGFEELLQDHVEAWDDLWSRFALQLEGDGSATQLTLHLHTFHLLQTTSRNTIDLDVGVPARGLHGEAYRGHVFWDELFILPFLTMRLPELVRSLLLYRFRRLPEARWAAAEAGVSGAMFPWQSASSGREETQTLHLNPLSGRWLPDASHLQRHINSAVAYNIWHYYQATADTEFMISYGAEMIFEISRFWASMARYNPDLDRYEIKGVMGPDEYHDGYPGAAAPGLDNNSYTNVMAVWVLCRALDLIADLPDPRRSELRRELSLDDAELARWDDVSRKMRVVLHEDGVISQFEGYEDLAELDWQHYHDRYGDISRLDRILEEEHDSPNAYKASKQADVLMLFYLLSADELQALFHRLGYSFDDESIPRNIDYYLRRTCHGSTLSRVVHAWVMARSDRERSWEFFEDALRSDLDDTQGGTTAEGVHLGAMAGTLDLLQRCYLGIETREDAIWFNPLLPAEVRSLKLGIRYRRQWLSVTAEKGVFSVELGDWGQGTVLVGMDGDVAELGRGDRRQLEL